MTLAARAWALSPVVHAVDDGGSLCGAGPRPRWRGVRKFPVNCPACLVRLATPRYALCGAPAASVDARAMHIRQIGPEGLRKEGGAIRGLTLCGQPAGWDHRRLEAADLEAVSGLLCSRCAASFRANAVR